MAIIPVYIEENYQGTGLTLFGLRPADHEKIRQGYGCPNCLEDFTEWGAHGMVAAFAKCPVCGHRIDANHDFTVPPQYWLPDPTDS